MNHNITPVNLIDTFMGNEYLHEDSTTQVQSPYSGNTTIETTSLITQSDGSPLSMAGLQAIGNGIPTPLTSQHEVNLAFIDLNSLSRNGSMTDDSTVQSPLYVGTLDNQGTFYDANVTDTDIRRHQLDRDGLVYIGSSLEVPVQQRINGAVRRLWPQEDSPMSPPMEITQFGTFPLSPILPTYFNPDVYRMVTPDSLVFTPLFDEW